MAEHKPVLFEDSQGNILTNDPIYRAQEILRQAKVDLPDEVLTENVTPAAPSANDIDSDFTTNVDDTEDDDDGDRYDQMNGTELKAEAKERNIDTAGMTKVGELREALRAADAEK